MRDVPPRRLAPCHPHIMNSACPPETQSIPLPPALPRPQVHTLQRQLSRPAKKHFRKMELICVPKQTLWETLITGPSGSASLALPARQVSCNMSQTLWMERSHLTLILKLVALHQVMLRRGHSIKYQLRAEICTPGSLFFHPEELRTCCLRYTGTAARSYSLGSIEYDS